MIGHGQAVAPPADPHPWHESLGQGPDLVLLHGWGLHSGVWDGLAAPLATRYRVTLIDLPGFGRSALAPGRFTLPRLASAVAAVAPPRATWVGWSLGGMIALQLAASHPERVAQLMLVASTPRFGATADWQQALDPAVLAQFHADLAHDYRGTLLRFLALQVRGSARGRDELRRLRAEVFRFGEPTAEALSGGLRVLQQADLRPQLAALGCPLLVLLGARDTLVPAAVGAAIGALCPAARVSTLEGAAHAPFLSHPDRFLAMLQGLIDG